jgi:SpoVK/Ycf46/Vps4 family AAA+-type ATPase
MSTVTSKWFGESNKYVRAVFTLAAKLAPVVIFIDEVDALLSARSKDENQSLREMKTELMLHWDGLRTREGEQTVVLAATNRPFDLDEAVLRRLPRRILVPLPDQAARAQILRLILRDEALQAGFPLEQLAARTDGYSGSDLKALCVRAAHEPIRELLRAEAVVEASGAPAVEPGVGGAALRPVQFSDFVREDGSELVIASSVSKQSTTLDELLRWNEQYGETRGDAPNQQLSYYT